MLVFIYSAHSVGLISLQKDNNWGQKKMGWDLQTIRQHNTTISCKTGNEQWHMKKTTTRKAEHVTRNFLFSIHSQTKHSKTYLQIKGTKVINIQRLGFLEI